MTIIPGEENKNSRRDFLKKSTLAGIGTFAGVASAIPVTNNEIKSLPNNTSTRFTILYTSDIHAQLHTHDEFFWENGKAVYKKKRWTGSIENDDQPLQEAKPCQHIIN
jgi:Ca2+/H+ antiporter